MTNEIKKFGLIFMPINWVICITVTAILYFGFNKSWGLGYLLGSLTSYLTFGLHMKNANDYGSKGANAYMQAFTNSGVRFLISAAMLLIAFFLNDEFNLIATFIGMMVIKVLLFVFSIIREIIIKKKSKGGEEAQL